jgi:hypothetical protein
MIDGVQVYLYFSSRVVCIVDLGMKRKLGPSQQVQNIIGFG